MRWLGKTMMALGAMAPTAAASAQVFDPAVPDSAIAGPRSHVLVLGTPHLDGMPAKFRVADLSALLDRLAAWKPDIVTIEGVSGAQCDMLERYKATNPDAASHYCADRSAAAKATGLDVPAAMAEVERLLAAWPAAPTAAQRRRLAAMFLASGDRASAQVQWLRIVPAERRAGDGLDTALVTALDTSIGRANESYAIAAALAARLGLERVYPVDDHSSDSVNGNDPAFETAMQRIWNNPVVKRRTALTEAAEAGLGTPAGTLALYRYYNTPALARMAFDSDFGRALADVTPQQFGRRYVAWWEVRNLRMVANIRAAMAPYPGARVLAVVGASHKGYYEAYLSRMHDIRIDDIGTVLR